MRNILESSPKRLLKGIVERVVHSLVDAIGDIEIEFVHGINRELPGIILFKAPGFVGPKPDGMVSDFMEKDCCRHRAFGLWRLQKLGHRAISIGHLPCDSRHG